ncbi:MAG TPA: amidohydrolase family protein [Stellaceae bacterium]|nr:amidohydrolase family protein [Stellaceae bacterium]
MAEATRGGRIDVHHHFYAPDYLAAMGDNAKRPEIRDWTLARTLEEMDRNGVAAACLSLSPPGIHRGGEAETRRLARAINEHAAKLRSEHPARFGHFASIPMPHVEATLAEIAYALDTLKADGVQMMTSYGDRWPGHPDFDPVFDELNRRKAVVFVHPLLPQCCANVLNWMPPSLAEFTHDTNRCVFNLLLTGTLARCPDIRFIFCHAGAAVPILAGRAIVTGVERHFAAKLPHGIDHELKKLHYDVALAGNRPALAALFAYVPVSQVLLGSDYPFGTSADGIAGLEAFGLPRADLDRIYRGNAERLIPRLKA